MVIRPLCIGLIALGAPLWLLALWLPQAAFVAWLYGFTIVGLVVLQYRSLAVARNIKIRRSLPNRFSQNSEYEIGLTLDNPTQQNLEIRLQDNFPSAFLMCSQMQRFNLQAGQSIEVGYTLKAEQRGVHQFKGFSIRANTARGLVERSFHINQSDTAKIYPAFLGVDQVDLMAKIDHQQDSLKRAHRVRGAGKEFESLRNYVLGDDMRHMDWKASAKRNQWIVKDFQIEKGQSLAVLIDCGRLMSGKIGNLTKLDHAMNAAVMLSHVTQQRGDSLVMSCFSNKIEALMPPTKGLNIVPAVLESLLGVHPSQEESNYWHVVAHIMGALRKRSLVIIFTDIIDKVSSAGLIKNLVRSAQKHVVLCVVLSDVSVAQIADTNPKQPQETWTHAAASFIESQKQLSLNYLKSKGVFILETHPDSLSIQLVQRYLEIRRSDLL